MNELFPILSESYLSWNANLVAVEVVGLFAACSVFGCLIADLCQGFLRTAHTLRLEGLILATAYFRLLQILYFTGEINYEKTRNYFKYANGFSWGNL